MIARLRGTVLALGGTWVVLDVNGVGFRVLASPGTTMKLRPGEQAHLHTSLVVREDSMTLYGFAGADELECFELAQSASGIGPKIALAIVSVLSPSEFVRAVRTDDLRALCRVPGIGHKGAQKLVIELKDRVAVLSLADPRGDEHQRPPSNAWQGRVAEGLQGLGWSSRDAEKACEAVAPMVEENPEMGIADLMRAALVSLARV